MTHPPAVLRAGDHPGRRRWPGPVTAKKPCPCSPTPRYGEHGQGGTEYLVELSLPARTLTDLEQER
ncbi:MAG: hypothetical protein ACRDRP_08715 [Pseudonocardiaceae bacterium]